jgi:hypothetical protein
VLRAGAPGVSTDIPISTSSQRFAAPRNVLTIDFGCEVASSFLESKNFVPTPDDFKARVGSFDPHLPLREKTEDGQKARGLSRLTFPQ